MLKRLLLALLGVVVLGVGAVVVYTELIRDDADPIGFREADDPTLRTEPGDTPSATDEPSDATTTTASTDAVVAVDGTWTVTEGTEVGYFVLEDFAGGLSDSTALGSTPAVEGTLEIVGDRVTAATFSADLTQLTSDESRRDSRAQQVLQTDTFPSAVFTLTAPLAFGTPSEPEQIVSAEGTGDLTVRDVTMAVTVEVEAKLTAGGELEIVGAIPTTWSDYGVENPSNPFVTVRNDGEIQFRLVLTRG